MNFTEKLYQKAICDFVSDMNKAGLYPSHDKYTEWCAAMNAAGNKYPSSSSIRNYFRNWTAALRFAQGETGSLSAAEQDLPTSPAETEDGTATCPICSHEAWPIVRGLWCPPADNPEPKVWPAGCVITSEEQEKWHCMNNGCGWEW
ncbi:hypothetical protein [Arthrobacter sp. zg-Y877]|uniref:hypothetical protein n=1 Tax=Arthrobacter sp. zg-Y877 TaxID=3049074 RepID=UPI0025A3242D|nr:hypothetical protein [Arthrobacter sp. zg-Y877]MDM7990722.1 hypothetical protein [Arthrobacter sp. zg-Y877]